MARKSGSATSRSNSIPPATCWARRRSRSPARTPASSPPATTRTRADPTCAPFEVVPCDVFITEATFGLPVFRHGDAADEVKKLLASVALFPERAHLVGAYSLGKAQRVIALLREAGYDAPIYLHGAMEAITHYYQSRGVALGELRAGQGREEGRSRRHHHAGAAVGHLRHLDAAVSRSGHGLRLGLDAGARPRPPARRRTAAGDFRPRRLGRADRDHRGHRRRRNLGHPRPGRRAGALVQDARALRRGRSTSSAMATRTRARRSPADEAEA